MSTFNVLGTLLLFSALNTSAKITHENNFLKNPNFLGVWEEKNYINGNLLKIQKVNINNSKYNYVIKKRIIDLFLKDKVYKIEYVGFLSGNSLIALSREGKKKNFYILRNGILTDLDQYYMIRKK
ncbi:hypothetical protein F891_00003 [Acinetobacter sp. CIP 101966]|uniref:hypothetical protein n=1 Tax=Acinetobacter sp. CIP 101966 TaxID=1144662 RepID=UPI0002CF5861|nr:hypothetical protein [Acinetobacter sp. CIP 101966]ENX31515.1 hypothetical protein F891_00003 [Acinetobacter sp. CIP 101966]